MFTIEITPQPAARPRVTSTGGVNTKKYSNYLKELATYLTRIPIKKPINYPLHLEITFYLPIPKMSQKKTLEHENKYHIKKPDWSNLLKAFEDAGNGIVWKDDSLICSYGNCAKRYSKKPRIEFDLKKIIS